MDTVRSDGRSYQQRIFLWKVLIRHDFYRISAVFKQPAGRSIRKCEMSWALCALIRLQAEFTCASMPPTRRIGRYVRVLVHGLVGRMRPCRSELLVCVQRGKCRGGEFVRIDGAGEYARSGHRGWTVHATQLDVAAGLLDIPGCSM